MTISTYYLGFGLPPFAGSPLDATSGAAVEWAETLPPGMWCRTPCPGTVVVAYVEKFANRIWVRRYNATTKQLFPHQWIATDYVSSRGWIQNVGHDFDCAFLGGQCAWFVFQDQYDRAVVFGVNASGSWVFGDAFSGLDPSGESGQVGSEQRKMVAYVTSRTGPGQVRARFYDDWMNVIADVAMYDYPQTVEVYQTASAWDPISHNFLVAWTERDTQVNHHAAVMHRVIGWDWALGAEPSPTNPAIVCANGAAGDCGGVGAAGGSAPLVGTCACSRLWATSGYTDWFYYDSFRMYSYNAMARLYSDGTLFGWRDVGQQFLPLTQLNKVSTPSGTAVYQSIKGDGTLQYWIRGNQLDELQSQVMSVGPEAFRAELRFVAAAVGSDKSSIDPNPATLKLSVVPFGTPAASCPP